MGSQREEQDALPDPTKMFSSCSVTRFKNDLVAVLLLRRPMHTRRGAESLLSDCVCALAAFSQRRRKHCGAVRGRGSWHVVAARGPHGERSSQCALRHGHTARGPCEREGNKRAKRMWAWAIRAPLGSTRRRCAVRELVASSILTI